MKAISLVIQELNTTTPFSGWSDSSSANDACGSVHYTDGVQVYLPNTTDPDPDDCESFNTFSICIENLYDDDSARLEYTARTLQEVVRLLNKDEVKNAILRIKRRNRKESLAHERKHVHDRLKRVEGQWSHSNIGTHEYIEALIEGLRDLQKSDF